MAPSPRPTACPTLLPTGNWPTSDPAAWDAGDPDHAALSSAAAAALPAEYRGSDGDAWPSAAPSAEQSDDGVTVNGTAAGGECAAVCMGFTCETYVHESCLLLQSEFGCDCPGCHCGEELDIAHRGLPLRSPGLGRERTLAEQKIILVYSNATLNETDYFVDDDHSYVEELMLPRAPAPLGRGARPMPRSLPIPPKVA